MTEYKIIPSLVKFCRSYYQITFLLRFCEPARLEYFLFWIAIHHFAWPLKLYMVFFIKSMLLMLYFKVKISFVVYLDFP